MTGVGFKPTTSVFVWDKILHALDSAVTVSGIVSAYGCA
jgi:hypothetical protein